MCKPVPGTAEALDRIRETDAAVVFLSDTDRSSALLSGILADSDIFKEGDHLIASCEAGSTKSEGALFSQTWPDRSNGQVIWHAGNHLWADSAARSGRQPV